MPTALGRWPRVIEIVRETRVTLIEPRFGVETAFTQRGGYSEV